MKNKGWKRQGSVPGAVLLGISFCLAWIWAGSCAISGAAAAYGAESLPDRTEETPAAERFLYWIKKHLTKVVFGTGFFILILGGTALLWMSRRREKRESESPDKGPGS